jgi:hypothetical protein
MNFNFTFHELKLDLTFTHEVPCYMVKAFPFSNFHLVGALGNVIVWHACVVGPMAWVPFARNPIA